MSDNPFQAPHIVVEHSRSRDVNDQSERVALMLKQTKPWVRFISVLTFICGGLMLLGAGLFMIFGAIAGMGAAELSLGLIYVVLGILYLIPAIYLWRYADRTATFLRSRSDTDLASALEAQKSFWRYVGICMLVLLILYAVGFVLALLVGVAALTRF